MRKLESSVERAFVRKCKQLKVLQVKLGYDSFPDRIALVPCKMIFIEFKSPGEDLRPNQKSKIKRLRDLGLTVHVIDNNKDAIDLAIQLSKI